MAETYLGIGEAQELEDRKDSGIRRFGQQRPPREDTLGSSAAAQRFRAGLERIVPTDSEKPWESFNKRRSLLDIKLKREYPNLDDAKKAKIMSMAGVGNEQDPGDFSRGEGITDSISRGWERGMNLLRALPDGAQAFYGYLANDPQSLLEGLKGIEDDVRENSQIYEYEMRGGDPGVLHKFLFDAVSSAPAMGAAMVGGAAASGIFAKIGVTGWLASLLGYGSADALLEGGFSFIDVVSDPVIRRKIAKKLGRDITGNDVNELSQEVMEELAGYGTKAGVSTGVSQFFLPTNILAGKMEKFVPARGSKSVLKDIRDGFVRSAGKEFLEEGAQSAVAQTYKGAVESQIDSGDKGLTGYIGNIPTGVSNIDLGDVAYEGTLGALMGGPINVAGDLMPKFGARKQYFQGGEDHVSENEVRQKVRKYIAQGDAGLSGMDSWLTKNDGNKRLVEIANSELNDMRNSKQLLHSDKLTSDELYYNSNQADKFEVGQWNRSVNINEMGDSADKPTNELTIDPEMNALYWELQSYINDGTATDAEKARLNILKNNPRMKFKDFKRYVDSGLGRSSDDTRGGDSGGKKKKKSKEFKLGYYPDFTRADKARAELGRQGYDIQQIAILQSGEGKNAKFRLDIPDAARPAEEAETTSAGGERVVSQGAGTQRQQTSSQINVPETQTTETAPAETAENTEPINFEDSPKETAQPTNLENKLKQPVVDEMQLPDWETQYTLDEQPQRKEAQGGKVRTVWTELHERLKFAAAEIHGSEAVADATKKANKEKALFPGTNVTWADINTEIKKELMKLGNANRINVADHATKTWVEGGKKDPKKRGTNRQYFYSKSERESVFQNVMSTIGLSGQAPASTDAPASTAFDVPETTESEAAPVVDDSPAMSVQEATEYMMTKGMFGTEESPNMQRMRALTAAKQIQKDAGTTELTQNIIDDWFAGTLNKPKAGKKEQVVTQDTAIDEIGEFLQGREKDKNDEVVPTKNSNVLKFNTNNKDKDIIQGEYFNEIEEIINEIGDGIDKSHIKGAKKAISRLVAGHTITESLGWVEGESQQKKDIRKQWIKENIESGGADIPAPDGMAPQAEAIAPTYALDEQGNVIQEAGSTAPIQEGNELLGEDVLISTANEPIAIPAVDEFGNSIIEPGKWLEKTNKRYLGNAKRFKYIGDAKDGGHIFREVSLATGQEIQNKDRGGSTRGGDAATSYNDVVTTSADKKNAAQARKMWNFLRMDVQEAAGRPDKSVMLFKEELSQSEIDKSAEWVEGEDGSGFKDTDEAERRRVNKVAIEKVVGERKQVGDKLTAINTQNEKDRKRLEQLQQNDPESALIEQIPVEMKKRAKEEFDLRAKVDDLDSKKAQLIGEPAPGRTRPNAPIPKSVKEKKYKTEGGKAKARLRSQIKSNGRLIKEITAAEGKLTHPDVLDPLNALTDKLLMSLERRKEDIEWIGAAEGDAGVYLSMVFNVPAEMQQDVTDVLTLAGWQTVSISPSGDKLGYVIRTFDPNNELVKLDLDKDYTTQRPRVSEEERIYAQRLRDSISNRRRANTSVGGGGMEGTWRSTQVGVYSDQSNAVPSEVKVTGGRDGSTLAVSAVNPLQSLINAGRNPDQKTSMSETASDIVNALEMPQQVQTLISTYGDTVTPQEMSEILNNPDTKPFFDINLEVGGVETSKAVKNRIAEAVMESQREKDFYGPGQDAFRIADMWAVRQLINNYEVGEKIVANYEKASVLFEGVPAQDTEFSPLKDMVRAIAEAANTINSIPDKDIQDDAKAAAAEPLLNAISTGDRLQWWMDMREEAKPIGVEAVDTLIYGTPDPSANHRAMVDKIEIFLLANGDKALATARDLSTYVRTSAKDDRKTAISLLEQAIKENGKLGGVYTREGNPNFDDFMLRLLIDNDGGKRSTGGIFPSIKSLQEAVETDPDIGDPKTGVLLRDRTAMEESIMETGDLAPLAMEDPVSGIAQGEQMDGTTYFPLWSKDFTAYKNLAAHLVQQYAKDTGAMKMLDPGSLMGVVDGNGKPASVPVIRPADLYNAFGVTGADGNWTSGFGVTKQELASIPQAFRNVKGWISSAKTYDNTFKFDNEFDFKGSPEDPPGVIYSSQISPSSKENQKAIKEQLKKVVRAGVYQYIDAQIKVDPEMAKISLQDAKNLLLVADKNKLAQTLEEAGVGKGEQQSKKKISSKPLR